MLPILPIDIPTTMRRSLTGARPDDPVLPDRKPRAPRRSPVPRLAPRRPSAARKPAAAPDG